MRKLLRWRLVLGTCALACALTSVGLAEEKPAAGEGDKDHKMLVDVLRDVHNRGADLYNGGDPAACYRMFQGALLTAKSLVGADVQKVITDGLARAESDPRIDRRAFLLHETIESVRTKLKPAGAAKTGDKKPAETSKPPEKKPVETTKPPVAKTMWERLGGEANVKKVVDDFVAMAATDPKVNFDRNGKYKLDEATVSHLKKELIDFVSLATGGPHKYTGKSMKEVHKGMGITDAEFDAAAADLKKALQKNGADPADIDLVMNAVGGTRKDIVEPRKPEDKKPESKPDDKKPEKKPEDKKPEKKPEDKKPEDKTSALRGNGDTFAAEPAEEKKADGASLEGKVTFKGKPLDRGTITFVDAAGKSSSAKIQADGTYNLKEVKAGKYKLTLTGTDTVKVPVKYGSVETSGLTVTITKGKQNFDLVLE